MSTFRLSLALLGLTSFAAPAVAHAEAVAGIATRATSAPQHGLAVDQASHPAQQYPPFHKPVAHIETATESRTSWGGLGRTRLTSFIRGEIQGAPLSGTVVISALGEPKPITLPEGELRRATGPASVRKATNRAYNREVRKQIAMAQNKKEIFKIDADHISKSGDTNAAVPYSGKTVKLANEPVTVAARTPLDVTATDKFGRSKTTRTEAVGVPFLGSEGIDAIMHWGGEVAGTMKPPVQTENIRVSRPFVNSKGETMVKVLSLGAFAGNNATVRVINRETGAEVAMQKISRAGGGAIAIPAYRKTDLRLVVEYAAVDKRSLASKTVYDFQAPDTDAAESSRHAVYEKVSLTKVE